MEDSFIGVVQDILSYLRSLPMCHDHSDRLIVIAGLLLIIYFVGSMIRNLLIGALIIFLLWGGRYQDAGYSQHVNRYTGAVCDVSRECWQPEKFPNFYERLSYR